MAVTTMEQFRQRIEDRLLVDPDEIPHGSSCAWFADPVTGRPTRFDHQQPVPFDAPYSLVIAIFQGDQTIRIYTMGANPPSPRPADWQERPPMRYTLSRSSATYVAEVLSLQVMADAIAEESNALAGETDDADDELELVVEWLHEQPAQLDRDKIIASLTDGAHRGEDEPTPVVATAAPAAQPS